MASKDSNTSSASRDESRDGTDMATIAAREAEAEHRTLESRKDLHALVDQQIAEFLARGGKITQVPSKVSGDPPKKPLNDYGNRPI